MQHISKQTKRLAGLGIVTIRSDGSWRYVNQPQPAKRRRNGEPVRKGKFSRVDVERRKYVPVWKEGKRWEKAYVLHTTKGWRRDSDFDREGWTVAK